MIRHRDCDGIFVQYQIREHHYCFMRCSKCGHYLGGDREKQKVDKLMSIKVRPTIRRA